MRRREFITALGVAAVWPRVAHAQQPERMRHVSVLVGLNENDPEAQGRVKAFRLGLRDLGWSEGRNVQVEYRFTGSNLESINKHVAEVQVLHYTPSTRRQMAFPRSHCRLCPQSRRYSQ
jgi:hypothetical protein